MVYALLICRSLTYAQRTAAVLERSGILTSLRRTPAALAPTGCSYAVKLPADRLTAALDRLARAELMPKSAVLLRADGTAEEVPL